ncbi:SMI1/KNR4 family protein [Chitinophaga caseinilytica]|uniref:SMI1/KNR4 family protein n=1 Tax=Chitinophaga caseinilytica TaxID=2267521 RepID=A0ABZ2Z2V3_9BACT
MDKLIQKLIAAEDSAVPTEPFQFKFVNFALDDKNVDAYKEFLTRLGNGGFYFNRSLQLYGFSGQEAFKNANEINIQIQTHFGKLAEKLFAFGQDIFGYQFAFIEGSSDIVYFNSETGEKEIMANSFSEWLQVLEDKLDYYTGEPFMIDWIKEKGKLDIDARLIPIKPFVIGGDYEVDNLHVLHFPKYLEYYADMARQISVLPDGAAVRLTIRNI